MEVKSEADGISILPRSCESQQTLDSRRRHTVFGSSSSSSTNSLTRPVCSTPIHINKGTQDFNRTPSFSGLSTQSKRRHHSARRGTQNTDFHTNFLDPNDDDDSDIYSRSLPSTLSKSSFFGLRPPLSPASILTTPETPSTSFSTSTSNEALSSSNATKLLAKRNQMGILFEDNHQVGGSIDSQGFPVTDTQNASVIENEPIAMKQNSALELEERDENQMKGADTHASNLANEPVIHKKERIIQNSCVFSFVQAEQEEDRFTADRMDVSVNKPEGEKTSRPPFRRLLSKRKSEVLLNLKGVSNNDRNESVRDNTSPKDIPKDENIGKDGTKPSSDWNNFFAPSSPKTRKVEDFDPYQIFQVQNAPCLIFKVKVLRGRNITLGFQDYYDTPDPYVFLKMDTSPEGRKCTTVKTDEPNPVWDEEFTFFINFTQNNVLEIHLKESNLLWFDQTVGSLSFDICNIKEMDVPQKETFFFNGVCEVDMEFLLGFDKDPTLRYSLCLSDAEKAFQEARKKKVMEGLRSLLGEKEGPMNINEVPTIAVIGSGGGFRALTAYSGVMKALVETGVLDCVSYTGGLSGSAWLLSTLYSHPKWPDIDMGDFVDELMNSVDKNLRRFFNPSTMYQYASCMVKKRNDGQPVSFTDIFGRMVGETLLQGRMDVTLTDQREKIKDGKTPMPLYTCVHVKKDVPAKSFQEWVEFSPYEIGLPKYGTFMDSSLFGSKFFMGKLVKQYEEQPLHFLQGIWGSAFCILFKRLLEDNRRIDPAEMIRLEMNKQLEEAQNESSSDCSDNDEDENFSSTDSNESLEEKVKTLEGANSIDSTTSNESMDSQCGMTNKVSSTDSHDSVYDRKVDDDDDDNDGDDDDDDDEDDDDCEVSIPFSNIRKGSLETLQQKKDSLTKPEPIALKGIINRNASCSDVPNQDQLNASRKSVNWGKCPVVPKSGDRRQAFAKSSSSSRKSRSGSKSYWKKFMKTIFESENSLSFLNTRQGRAAVIHNFMRGLSLQQTFPLSPFTPFHDRVTEGDEFDGIFEMHPTSVKHIYMVDAGLTFNSPYPLVLRPQREVDIILSFDFSARPSDNHNPFKELLLAEKWAYLNRLPFPPIDSSVYEKEGMKELYVFKHPTDPHCPIVLHFVLINKDFKLYSKPGVPRQTKEEFDFAEFDIFDDPEAPYSTFNFTYPHNSFQRLSKLTEFNTLLHLEDIKQAMKDCILKKRANPARYNMADKETFLLSMTSVIEMKKKMHKFIRRLGSVRAPESITPPFLTPTLDTVSFFGGFKRGVSNASSDDGSVFTTPRERFFDEPDFRGQKSRSPEALSPFEVNSIKRKEMQQNHSTSPHMIPVRSPFEKLSSDGNLSHVNFVQSNVLSSGVETPTNPTNDPLHSSANQQGTSNLFSQNSSQVNTKEGHFIPNQPKKKISPPNLFFANLPHLSSSSSETGSPDSANYLHQIGKNSIKNKHFRHLPSNNSTLKNSPMSPEVMRLRKGKAYSRRKNMPISENEFDSSSSTDSSLTPTIQTPDVSRTQEQIADSSPQTPQRAQSQVSAEETFSLAPQAFQSDGTPVYDSKDAKMYHEEAKNRRQKMFRRQSTISSLNSMSLDEINEYYYDTVSQIEDMNDKNKNTTQSMDSGYNSTGIATHQESIDKRTHLNNESESSQSVQVKPNPNVIDFQYLTQFGSGDTEMKTVNETSKVDPRYERLSSYDVWYDTQE